MKIAIVGAGIVGSSLAEELSRGRHSIAVIDTNQKRCDLLQEKLDVMVACGSGSNPKLLKEIGIEEIDMVIAVTSSDETNIVVCALARTFGVKRRIARIRNSDLSHSTIDITKLGVTRVITPEKVVADSIMQFIESPGTTDSANFGNGNVLIRGFKITDSVPILNRTVREISEMSDPHVILVVAIIREGNAIIPTANDAILVKDEVFSIFPRSSLNAYQNLMRGTHKKPRKVVISGDSEVAIDLAKLLEGTIDSVVIIDPDPEHGKYAAGVLNSTEVLHGDCTDLEMLQEVRIDGADVFVAASKKGEDNIMSALLVKSEGVKEVIALHNNPKYSKRFGSLGIDHIISMRNATTREILEVVHQGQIGATIGKRDANIEAIRMFAGKNSRIVGKPLAKVWGRIRNGAIIGAIIRDDVMHVPRGNMVIEEGDDVIVISDLDHVNVVTDLFKPR